MISREEWEEVIAEWNETAEITSERCVHELFGQQVEMTPDTVAVVYEGEQLTYEELNRRANQLAHYLRMMGVGPEVNVGLCVDRSLEMIVALLGVMKAGGAYLPLEPDFPLERLSYMIEDGQCPVTIVTSSAADKLRGINTTILALDEDWEQIAQRPDHNPDAAVLPDNSAYVIYTSGSTGRPKGVEVGHRQLVNYSTAIIDKLKPAAGASFALISTIAADLGNTMLFPSLLGGGCLHVISRERAWDAHATADYFTNEQIDYLKIVPSHLRALSANGEGVLPNLVLVIGGEAASATWIKQWRRQKPAMRVVNHYGPTETTVGVLTQEVEDEERWETGSGQVVLGRPMRNAQVYILDEQQEAVPVGVAGEVYIGGEGVARGYVRRGAETAERFLPNPYAREAGGRMYRTGDRGRQEEDGKVEYLGRVDDQVKVRGYRIELGEIEAAIGGHPSVKQAVVVAREDEPGDKRLVGYVVAKQEVSQSELKEYLRERLPEYMVPAVIVELSQMPLTANGKIDRGALPEPELSRADSQYVEPQTAVEEIVCGIWAEVLRIEKVGTCDKFFEMGGHSLLAMQIVARVRNTLGVEIPLQTLLTNQTAAAFAAEVEKQRRNGEAPVEPIRRVARNQDLPLSYAQQNLWFNDQLNPGSAAYSIPYAVRLRGRLDVDALRRSLNEIVRRHEVLRTSFPSRNGKARQEVQEAGELQTDFVDLMQSDEAGQEQNLRAVLQDEVKRGFDLSSGPLMRAKLVRLNEAEHVLMVNMHHIISDAWSVKIIVSEFAQLYEAYTQGLQSPLPDLDIQYADYALWQREWLQGEVLDRQLQYWRRQLQGLTILELPTDRARSAAASYRGASERIVLSEELTEKLKQMSRREGVTMFMSLLAGFQVLLARYSGQEDIAIGTPIAGRNRQETESLVGLFIKALVMRVNLGGNPSVSELLARVREAALGAYAHQDVPFERIVEEIRPERSLSHQPLFQVWFVSQDIPAVKIDLPGLRVESIGGDDSFTKFDLMLSVSEGEKEMTATMRYSTELFDGRRIKRMLSHYEYILEGMAADEES